MNKKMKTNKNKICKKYFKKRRAQYIIANVEVFFKYFFCDKNNLIITFFFNYFLKL